MENPTPRSRRAEAARQVLTRYEVRLLLSFLIVVSVCPFAFVDELWWLFFIVFGVEFGARLWALKSGSSDDTVSGDISARGRVVEMFVLGLDLLAWLSFLPLHLLTRARFLRLVRLSRLVLLLTYWGSTFRSLWHLLRREERVAQLKLLLGSVVGLTFVAAVILAEFTTPGVASELGIETPVRFTDVLWWSFRQIQDPGNLVGHASHIGLVALSLTLTIGGLFLFSFLIGIGTSVVEELIEVSREQPIGLRDHDVIINVGPHTHYFLDQVVDYYRKQLSKPRWVAMGESRHAEIVANPRFRGIAYRRGTAYLPEDLAKVDVSAARRIVLLANPGLESPDTDTVAAVLSARQANPTALIYAELHDERSRPAVIGAGGPAHTVAVATEHLLGLALANLVATPQSYAVMEDLMMARGSELYTYIYWGFTELPPGLGRAETFGEVVDWAYQRFGCLLIGLASPDEEGDHPRSRAHRVALHPAARPCGFDWKAPIKGLVGVCPSFDVLEQVALRLAAGEPARQLRREVPADGRAEVAALPELRLPRRGEAAPTVLVCGFRRRTARTIEHLLNFSPGARIFVMVEDGAGRDRARQQLLALNRPRRFSPPERDEGDARGRFAPGAGSTLVYRVPVGASGESPDADEDAGESGEIRGEITFLEGNWADRRDLLDRSASGFDLLAVDLIYIQTGLERTGDPDARAVTAVLTLEELSRAPELERRLTSRARVIVEISDELKAELLTHRFDRSRGAGLRVTVVPTERIRNVLMFQSTVVPSYPEIFLHLFSPGGAEFRRLIVEGTGELGEEFDFGALLRALYRSRRAILLGVELVEAGGQKRYVVNPAPDSPESRLPSAELHALYVVAGEGSVESAPDPDQGSKNQST